VVVRGLVRGGLHMPHKSGDQIPDGQMGKNSTSLSSRGMGRERKARKGWGGARGGVGTSMGARGA